MTIWHMLIACWIVAPTRLDVTLYVRCGPGSVAGIATGYGLDGPGIESLWGRDFPHLSRPALGPTQPPVQWVPGLSRGKERPGRDADPSPRSSAFGHERIKLYLYSPYGPYGMYRASVPVQGCTLPLPFICTLPVLFTMCVRISIMSHIKGRVHIGRSLIHVTRSWCKRRRR